MWSLIIKFGVSFGIATTFWSSNDPQNPNDLAFCTNKTLQDDAMVAAHPTLRCGSKVLVWNPSNGYSALVRIVDRGPRKALIDLSRAASKALGTKGKAPVFIFYPTP